MRHFLRITLSKFRIVSAEVSVNYSTETKTSRKRHISAYNIFNNFIFQLFDICFKPHQNSRDYFHASLNTIRPYFFYACLTGMRWTWEHAQRKFIARTFFWYPAVTRQQKVWTFWVHSWLKPQSCCVMPRFLDVNNLSYTDYAFV